MKIIARFDIDEAKAAECAKENGDEYRDPESFLRQESGWLEDSGFSLNETLVVDNEVSLTNCLNKTNPADKIFTHDEAMIIVEMFEDVLEEHGIIVPSPEDDEKEDSNETALYGSTYSDLLDSVEAKLIELLEKHHSDTEIIPDEFSGTV